MNRPNVSLELADTVRQMIVSQELEPGQRLNEVHLASQLGVSRTPLREALSSLVAEGALEVIPRRGFFVTPLSVEELQQIYPIRALLDPEALRVTGVPSGATLDKLDQLNEKLSAARGIEYRIRLDDEWHLTLIEACENKVLIDLVKQFIRRTHRYEYGYLKDNENVEIATAEHAQVVEALRGSNLELACDRLRQNLSTGLAPLVSWLEESVERR
jgi:DNA-binding GntR family transcriptional regulator